MKNPTCCLCGIECENQWGNNPYPLKNGEVERCCNTCNDTKVIPARIEAAMKRKAEAEENEKQEG